MPRSRTLAMFLPASIITGMLVAAELPARFSDATAAAAGETVWLPLDGENVYNCDEVFEEEGFTLWLSPTTAADCDGGGACSFGWSEGVIYMHPVRLVIDLTGFEVDSLTAYYWDVPEGDMRAFLYEGEELVDQSYGEFYGSQVTVRSQGRPVDQFALSACEGELYDIEVYLSEGTSDLNPADEAPLSWAPPYPNPSSGECRAVFALETASRVRIDIFDAGGRQVRSVLPSAQLPAGRHEWSWNGRNGEGIEVANGTYVARIDAGNRRIDQKIVLLR